MAANLFLVHNGSRRVQHNFELGLVADIISVIQHFLSVRGSPDSLIKSNSQSCF